MDPCNKHVAPVQIDFAAYAKYAPLFNGFDPATRTLSWHLMKQSAMQMCLVDMTCSRVCCRNTRGRCGTFVFTKDATYISKL